jgi:folate-binding protein YgfZ
MTGPYTLDRTLIRVSGPDARPFLQNLLTQDVNRLQEAGVLYGALLSPQGKVISDMLIWGDGGAVVLELDPSRGDDLLRRLGMYKLRAKVTVEDVSASFESLWAPQCFTAAQADPRLAALGWRSRIPRQTHRYADGSAAFETHRLTLGVPDLARDAAAEEVFALEALLEELDGVSFQKGCFIGQENVSRMKRRATTRKKFCPISFGGDPPPFGAPITAGGAEIGAVRTGLLGRAMALVRLDRAQEAQAAGTPLAAAGREVQLAPPDWLILPPRDAR